MQVALSVLGGVGALVVLTLAFVGVRYLTRSTPVVRVRGLGGNHDMPRTDDARFRSTMELLIDTPLKDGNHVELCLNGDGTYERLFADLSAARSTITLQMYYCQPGRLADQFARVLIERARAGVRVLFLHDAFGSQKLPEEYFERLRAAGVKVAVFRPVKWYALEKAYARSHIRVVVVDGQVAYTGGFGIDDKWLGDGRHEDQWRETNVRFRGPAVLQLQATFAAGWAEATGELLTGSDIFPVEEVDGEAATADGGMVGAILHCMPTIGCTPAERLLAMSIAGARSRFYLTNSYFVPDDDHVALLSDAARRGVDVRILTPGHLNDVKITWYAGRARYEALLANGVRIFWYQPSMMHAKAFVVDSCWCSVGTMNFDNRSLSFNDESNLVVLDERLGDAMQEVFLADLSHSKEVTLDEFRRRPRRERILEWGASKLARVL